MSSWRRGRLKCLLVDIIDGIQQCNAVLAITGFRRTCGVIVLNYRNLIIFSDVLRLKVRCPWASSCYAVLAPTPYMEYGVCKGAAGAGTGGDGDGG